jgi:hypothetical protein
LSSENARRFLGGRLVITMSVYWIFRA